MTKQHVMQKFKLNCTIYAIYNHVPIIQILNPIYGETCYQNIISKAFSWHNTKEGFFFWKNISDKWQQTLKNLEQNDNI